MYDQSFALRHTHTHTQVYVRVLLSPKKYREELKNALVERVGFQITKASAHTFDKQKHLQNKKTTEKDNASIVAE